VGEENGEKDDKGRKWIITVLDRGKSNLALVTIDEPTP